MSFEPTSATWDQRAEVVTETISATLLCVDPPRVESWLSDMDMDMICHVSAKMDERTCL